MATADLLVDTDVIIDHLRGVRTIPHADRQLAVSVVTRCELFAGRDTPALLRSLLRIMVEFAVDARVAELAGVTRRATGLATPDALIAATALVHGVPVMTRNRRHFDRVDGLRIISPG